MTQVQVSGPLFDGRAQRAATDLCDQLEYNVGWQAHAEAMGIMNASFRNPTPYYEVQVTVEPRGEEMVVHDRGIVYGPWLVTGRRRGKATRFRGYDMYRRAVIALKPKLHMLIQATLPEFLKRMG